MKKIATKEEWMLRCQLEHNALCIMMDEHGCLSESWQQELSKGLENLIASRRWSPMLIEKDGKYGLWNQFEEKLSIPVKFDEIGDVPEISDSTDTYDYAIPVRLGEKWGAVMPYSDDKTIIPFDYDEISYNNNVSGILQVTNRNSYYIFGTSHHVIFINDKI